MLEFREEGTGAKIEEAKHKSEEVKDMADLAKSSNKHGEGGSGDDGNVRNTKGAGNDQCPSDGVEGTLPMSNEGSCEERDCPSKRTGRKCPRHSPKVVWFVNRIDDTSDHSNHTIITGK